MHSSGQMVKSLRRSILAHRGAPSVEGQKRTRDGRRRGYLISLAAELLVGHGL